MKTILTIIRGNFRKGKSALISSFILMMVMSMTLICVLTVNINSKDRVNEAMDEAGFGDVVLFANNERIEKSGMNLSQYADKIKQYEYVEDVRTCQYVEVAIDTINGKKSGNAMIGESYDSSQYDFKVFKDNEQGMYPDRPPLKDGEICAPIAYQSVFGCKVGDVVYFRGAKDPMPYTIKYFFEDPFMGGSLIGVKTLLFTQHDFNELREISLGEDVDYLANGSIIDIVKSDNYQGSMINYIQDINKQTQIGNYAWLTLSKSQSASYMLSMTNIFCGILGAFIVLLLAVTLIVMGHSISSSIELDYVNLGILKAIGVTQQQLKYAMVLQYITASTLGILIGLPMSLPIIKLVNHITLPVNGIMVSNQLALGPCALVLLGILILMVLFIMIKLRRLTYIKPVRAIAGGREEVYFKSRLQAPIYKRWMNFWMALRQLTSNKKQYIGATAITALLIFFLMMVTAMNSWLSGDASVLNKMFSYYNSSMTVSYGDDSIRDDVENIIRSDSVIKDKYYMGSKYVCLNNNKMHCTYFENPDFCISVLEGRTCRYENEVLITKFVSKDLGIKIGDTVTVAVDNQSQEFTVSGIYQNGNDMGTNFAMSAKGMERITGNPVWDGYKKYILADETKTNDIVKKIQDKYSEKQVVVYNDRDIDENTQTIITSVKGISVIIYVITGIFVVVIILMICGKIFTRERIDNGIYKAVGFSSKRLRMQFAVRFALIAVIGSFFGLILYALLSGTLLGIIFSYMGFSQVNASTPILGIIIPILFMIIMFMLISYLISNKIKRVHTRILISE